MIQKMKKKAIGWLLCCMCLLVCAACSDDDGNNSDDDGYRLTVVGIVTDSENDWPLKGVNVELFYNWGGEKIVLGSTVTQKNGDFRLEVTSSKYFGLKDYYISVQKLDYQNELKKIKVGTFDRVQQVDINISMNRVSNGLILNE